MKKNVAIALPALAVLVMGCHCMMTGRDYGEVNYTGHGRFVDAGKKAGINRFALDLGQVDLNAGGERAFSLAGLPDAEMVCYVRVDAPLGLTGGPKHKIEWGDTILAMRVVDDTGKEVFAERNELSKWIWSGSVGASRSDLYTRKTIFAPAAGRSYELLVDVIPSKGRAPGAQLLLMGGGWKAERAEQRQEYNCLLHQRVYNP